MCLYMKKGGGVLLSTVTTTCFGTVSLADAVNKAIGEFISVEFGHNPFGFPL